MRALNKKEKPPVHR